VNSIDILEKNSSMEKRGLKSSAVYFWKWEWLGKTLLWLLIWLMRKEVYCFFFGVLYLMILHIT